MLDSQSSDTGSNPVGSTMEYTVRQPEEPSYYERSLGHRLDPKGLVNTPHPDDCEDCAQDPELGAQVHQGERIINETIEQLRPFFSEDTPDVLILNILMTAFSHMQDRLNENTQFEEAWKRARAD